MKDQLENVLRRIKGAKKKWGKVNSWKVATLVLMGAVVFSYFFEVEIHPKGTSPTPGESLGESAEDQAAAQAYLKFRELRASVIPSGVPEVYGQELGVSFDEVQDGINKLRVFGPTYGTEGTKIKLEGSGLERYIRIGKQTACQYCCGVTTLVDDKGEAACGCAHSIAMRGLVAYLIKNHPQKFSDEEMLAEANRWKVVFFPKQTLAAKVDELKKSGDTATEQLLEEFPDLLPQMVGGC